MNLEKRFNDLCASRHGYLMILVVGAGVGGFLMLAIKIIEAVIQ